MRLRRIIVEGGRYHVTARANRKEMILEQSETKELFLYVVKRAKAKYAFDIENFCILGNHFHFIIKPGKGVNLSGIMRWILGVFAMTWNRKHKMSGHVWGDRFYSRVIYSVQEFLHVFSYIDKNAVEAGIVKDASHWKFSGLWHAQNGREDILGKMAAWIIKFFPQYQLLVPKSS